DVIDLGGVLASVGEPVERTDPVGRYDEFRLRRLPRYEMLLQKGALSRSSAKVSFSSSTVILQASSAGFFPCLKPQVNLRMLLKLVLQRKLDNATVIAGAGALAAARDQSEAVRLPKVQAGRAEVHV